MKLTAHLQLVSNWGMSGAVLALPCVTLWCVLGQLCTVYLPVTDTVLQNGYWDVDAYIVFFYACINASVTVGIVNF